jgi:ABC-type multidrug transport system fused ATPase/permease subunit
MAARSVAMKNLEFKRNLSIYFSFVKNYKLIVISLLIVILSVEVMFLIEKYLFKLLIDRGTEFTADILTRAAFIDSIITLALIFLSITLFGLILYWFRPTLINKLEVNIIADMKRKFFRHILELDHNFHTTHRTGSLISRLTRGSSAMERMTDILAFNLFPLIVQIIAISFTMAYFDYSVLAIMLGTTVLHVSYSFYIQRLQENSSIIANQSEDIEKGNMADFFTNIDSIKYFGKEKIINNKYKDLSEKTKKAFLKNWNYFRLMRIGQGVILGSAMALLIYVTLTRFLAGEMTLGTITFIYTAYGGLVFHMFNFVGGLRNFYRAMADFQELFEYSKYTNEIKDKPDAKPLIIRKGTVEFKDINFSFGRRKIFNNFNLKIKENEKVALVGHSGCGKTTLLKLLKRFYDVDSGEILIDGKNIKDFKQSSVRNQTGIVPQECILFDDTLYNNIKFSNPLAPREKVEEAIRFAQLDKIIKHFPEREKTIVGERGVRLSGGEKQRVSIARSILANKKILILDEATSALDSETESEIQKDLQELLKGRTSIIIAHRLSTIMNADRIIVLKHGNIVQEGKHSQLINQQGEYKKLWSLQKGGYIK